MTVSTNNPVSPKVIAAASGAGIGGLLTTLTVWVIGVTAYAVPATADQVAAALAAVPTPISAVIGAVFVIGGAAVPGYQIADPARNPETNPNVVAYATPSGMVVAGSASPIETGTPVNVKQNVGVGVPDYVDEGTPLVQPDEFPEAGRNVNLDEPEGFDDGSDYDAKRAL